jgi:hypothetical protein
MTKRARIAAWQRISVRAEAQSESPMTTKQQRVLKHLEESDELRIDAEGRVVERTFHGIHGDAEDLAVSLVWMDATGCQWLANFTEQSLDDAEISSDFISLRDTEHQYVSIKGFSLEPVLMR